MDLVYHPVFDYVDDESLIYLRGACELRARAEIDDLLPTTEGSAGMLPKLKRLVVDMSKSKVRRITSDTFMMDYR